MKIPNNEKPVVSYLIEGVKCYIITQNTLKGKFTLYKVLENDYEKLATDSSPLTLYDVIKKDKERK